MDVGTRWVELNILKIADLLNMYTQQSKVRNV